MGGHSDLVERAGRWLSTTRRCGLVVQEGQCWSVGEFPDAIGWMPDGRSILVECKTSRSDFHADKRKISKQSGRETMGRERWYLTPRGLLSPEDLPDGYGLLETRGKHLKRVVRADETERPGRQEAELPLLISAARKEAWGAGWVGRQVRLVAIPCAEPS